MIRALLLYAATLTGAIVAITVALGVPLEWVAWTAFLVEAVPLATWAGAMLVRHMTREASETWTYTRPAPRLPVTRVTAEIVAPEYSIMFMTPSASTLAWLENDDDCRLQIEAPRREVEVRDDLVYSTDPRRMAARGCSQYPDNNLRSSAT